MVCAEASLVSDQPLAKKVDIIHGVAKPVIEGKDVVIVLANTKTDLRTSHFNKQRLGPPHQSRANAGALIFRCHGKIVYAVPVAVIPDHHGSNDIISFCRHPEGASFVGQFACNILLRIVPGPEKAAGISERDYGIRIFGLEIPDRKPIIRHPLSRPVDTAFIS